MKLSTVGIPLLIGLAVFFYLADIDGSPSTENNQKPDLKSPQPPSESPKPKGYKECMRLSKEQYKRDMSEFRRIRMQAEVTYGRIRDDRYGKGLNTITKEMLEREKECSED